MPSRLVRFLLPLLSMAALHARPVDAQVVSLPGTDRPLAGQPAPVFAVGAADGRSWEMLSRVRAAAFDGAGNLYLLDAGNHRVLVFDRTGRFVRQLGREGRGPGELTSPSAMDVTPEGGVVVLDALAGGYQLWKPDGTFDRSVRVEGFSPVARGGMGLHPRGGVVQTMRDLFSADRMRGNVLAETRVPLVHTPLSGGAPRRFYEVPYVQTTRVEGRGGEVSRVSISGPPVFSPVVAYGVLPDGNVAVTFTSGYTIRIVDLSGRTLRYLQRPLRARPVTARDRAAARAEAERLNANVRNVGGAAASADVPTADSVAVIRRMLVTDGGRIWVQRGRDDWFGHGPIDILDPAGRYLGTLPGQPMPLAVSATGRAAYVETDDVGVERVVVRQLPAAWR